MQIYLVDTLCLVELVTLEISTVSIYVSGGSTAVAAVVPLHLERDSCSTAGTSPGGGTVWYRWLQPAVLPLVVPPGVPLGRFCSLDSLRYPPVVASYYRWFPSILFEGSQRYYRQCRGSTAVPGSYGTSPRYRCSWVVQYTGYRSETSSGSTAGYENWA